MTPQNMYTGTRPQMNAIVRDSFAGEAWLFTSIKSNVPRLQVRAITCAASFDERMHVLRSVSDC